MKVLTVDFLAKNAAEQFARSLKETGFAVVKNHTVPQDLIYKVYSEWEAFFASEKKQNYLYDKETQDGYFPYLSENAKDQELSDLKEFYHYYPWGLHPKNLSAATQNLYNELSNLAAIFLGWLEEQTPDAIAQEFSMPLSHMIHNSHRTLLRILNYPALKGNEAEHSIRAAAHEDINLITLLPAATAPGLEVKDATGSWYSVACDPGTIVVNAADMLQMASKGFYRSTTHRVVNPEGESAKKARLSMPLFLHPRDDVRLSATHTATEYRLERLREIGLL